MAAKTGSTYISERTAAIIKIATANLRFSITASSKRVSPGDSNDSRQAELVAKTGNDLYLCAFLVISGIVTDSVTLQRQMGFSPMTSSIKVLPSDCDKTTDSRTSQDCHFRLSVVVASSAWSKFDPLSYIFRDINISGFGGHIPFPLIGRCRNHLAIVLSSSPWSKIPDFSFEFRCYLS